MAEHFETQQINGNPLDPLRKTTDTVGGPELFKLFSQVAHGFSHDDVVNAAINLLVNSIRQKCPTAQEAGRAFDEMAAKSKSLLLEQHYFPNGKRRSVFPFHQIIRPALVSDRDKFR